MFTKRSRSSTMNLFTSLFRASSAAGLVIFVLVFFFTSKVLTLYHTPPGGRDIDQRRRHREATRADRSDEVLNVVVVVRHLHRAVIPACQRERNNLLDDLTGDLRLH